MDGQPELTQALSIFGLIDLVGELTQDKSLTDLKTSTKVALAVGIPYVSSCQTQNQAGLMQNPQQAAGNPPAITGYNQGNGGWGSGIPIPVAIIAAALILSNSRQRDGYDVPEVSKQHPPGAADRTGRTS